MFLQVFFTDNNLNGDADQFHVCKLDAWPLWTILVNWLPKPVRRFTPKASYSLIASNVPGPRRPLYANGARVTEVISMGPLVLDLGLNVTGWSYCDEFTIGAVACREHVPDIWALMDAMIESFDELGALAPAASAREEVGDRGVPVGDVG